MNRQPTWVVFSLSKKEGFNFSPFKYMDHTTALQAARILAGTHPGIEFHIASLVMTMCQHLSPSPPVQAITYNN